MSTSTRSTRSTEGSKSGKTLAKTSQASSAVEFKAQCCCISIMKMCSVLAAVNVHCAQMQRPAVVARVYLYVTVKSVMKSEDDVVMNATTMRTSGLLSGW